MDATNERQCATCEYFRLESERLGKCSYGRTDLTVLTDFRCERHESVALDLDCAWECESCEALISPGDGDEPPVCLECLKEDAEHWVESMEEL